MVKPERCWMVGGCMKHPSKIIALDGGLYTLCITGISGRRAVTRAPKSRVFLSEADADEYIKIYNKYKLRASPDSSPSKRRSIC